MCTKYINLICLFINRIFILNILLLLVYKFQCVYIDREVSLRFICIIFAISECIIVFSNIDYFIILLNNRNNTIKQDQKIEFTHVNNIHGPFNKLLFINT